MVRVKVKKDEIPAQNANRNTNRRSSPAYIDPPLSKNILAEIYGSLHRQIIVVQHD